MVEIDEEIVWDMVVVGSPVCDTQHRELLKTYVAIAEEYLNLYELPNIQKNINCITESEYENLSSQDNVDLLIVIFDETLAQKTMRSNVFDGFYLHTGNDRDQNHVIVMCHCSNFEIGHERKYTSWILTHELSHFVLSWQGYDFAAVERLVHVLEDKYEHCTSIEGDNCTEQVYVSPPSLTASYPVFPPIKMASGINAIQSVDSDVKNDEILVGFYKQVTQWWLNDMIDNEAYLNATKQVFFSPLSLYSGMTIKDGMELPNGVIILDHAKEKPTNWKQVIYDDNLTAEEEIRLLLSYVPQDIVNAEKTSIPIWRNTSIS